MRFVTLAGVASIVLLVVGVSLVDEGEVVTLTTVDDAGRDVETDLWVVDVDGATLLRAGRPDAGWLRRLRARPDAELERGGATSEVRAVPVEDVAVLDAVNRAMRAKYGIVDAAAMFLVDHSNAMAVRVEPRGVARGSTP